MTKAPSLSRTRRPLRTRRSEFMPTLGESAPKLMPSAPVGKAAAPVDCAVFIDSSAELWADEEPDWRLLLVAPVEIQPATGKLRQSPRAYVWRCRRAVRQSCRIPLTHSAARSFADAARVDFRKSLGQTVPLHPWSAGVTKAARRQESREAGSGWFLWNRLQIAA